MKMILGGKQADASNGEVIEVLNPATGEVIDTVPAATEADVARAVDAAVEAQKLWNEVPVHERGAILLRFVELAKQNKEELARTLSNETGKTITEARGEIGNIFISFPAFVERAKHLYSEENHVLVTMREPIGVFACVIPFNFPCDLFDQKVAPTLMAGNAAIVKPSTDNPLTLCMLTKLLVQAGVTPGAIQILTGRGSTVGSWLCSNPKVHGITLTGSTEVGIETYKTAANHLAHIALELGGNDAFIVCADGDVDLAVEELIWGRMYNTGQVCCASKRFLVHNSLKDEFTEKAVARIQKIRRGNPADDDTEIGCLISEKAAIDVEAQVLKTVEQGGRIVLGGVRNGAFYEPTVIADVPKTADVAIDMEIFGPVVPIIGFDTVDEALAIANASKFGLCGCVFSRDAKTAWNVGRKLECGGVVLNGASFFRSFEMPFGGYKYSGVGTEGVLSTFDAVTRTKTYVLKNIIG